MDDGSPTCQAREGRSFSDLSYLAERLLSQLLYGAVGINVSE